MIKLFKHTNNKQIKGNRCHNCGTELKGDENFCPNCGQKNDKRRANIKLFLAEFVDNFVSLDSRLFRTIKLLFLKPGIVPNAYIKGQRKTYISPFRLLIISSLFYFVLSNIIDFAQSFTDDNRQELSVKAQQKYSYRKAVDSIIKTQNLVRIFNTDTVPENKKDSIYKALLQLKYKNDENAIDEVLSPMVKQSALEKIFYQKDIYYKKLFKVKKIDARKFEHYNWFKKMQIFTNILTDVRFKKAGFDKFADSLGIKKSKLNRYLFNKAKVIRDLNNNDTEKGQKLEKDTVSKISISLFFWLPVFTVFFMIFFADFKYNYTEFLIMVFYLQSVFFMFLVFYLIADLLIDSKWVVLSVLLAFFVYMLVFIKRFFKQSWTLSFFKTLSISTIYSIMAWVGFMIVLFITLLMS